MDNGWTTDGQRMDNGWTTVGLWYWLKRKLIEWKMAQKRRMGKRKAIRWLEKVY